MPDLSARIRELGSFESLASGRTAVHRVHPLAKLMITAVFIIFTVSFGRYDFIRLMPYVFYPFVLMALANLPYKMLLSRVLIALPFGLFAGVTNVFLDRDVAYAVGGFVITYGALSLATIMLKTYLCVMAVLLLVATTPFAELTAQLRRLHIPVVFIMVFETTFRYIGVLIDEAYSMITAYRLRSGAAKAVNIRHMGAFAGQLLLRAFDRAERVYAAMSCRGYSPRHAPPARKPYEWKDALVLIAVCVPIYVFRFVI